MATVAQTTTRRNEGGRYSTVSGSDWYKAIEAANLARIEAEEDAARALTTALATQVGNAVAAMPEAAARISKAARLVQRKDVWPMSDGTWLVGSQSDTEKAYLVRRGPWACDCADHTRRGDTCKHIAAVWLTIRLGAQYQASYN
jgi:hypothetical protein